MPSYLTPHFTLEELCHSQTAERYGLDNLPNDAQRRNLITLCTQILEPARIALGPLHIDSGFRSSQVNKLVGGSSTSAHLEGWAADVIPSGSSLLEALAPGAHKLGFARWVHQNVDFDQIILEYGVREMHGEPAWVHVSADPRGRGEVLRIFTGSDGYHPTLL